jgi:hypothetical protein
MHDKNLFPQRLPLRYSTHRPDFFPNGLYACRDGYLMLIVLPTDWPRFAEWVHEVTGNTTVLEEPAIASVPR